MSENIAMVMGRQIFCDLIEPGAARGFENNLRYGSTVLVPKDAEDQMEKLAEIVNSVGEKAWGREADEKLAAVWGAVENGVKPRFSPINIQDGDLHQPEYNAGHWVISARRPASSGRPALMTMDGRLCLEQDELVVRVEDVPKRYDGVVLVFEVWASKDQDRINFKLHGVRKAANSQSIADQPPSPQAVSALAGVSIPQLPGFGEPAPQLGAGDEPAPKKRGPSKKKKKAEPVEPEVVEPEPDEPSPTKAKRKSLFR